MPTSIRENILTELATRTGAVRNGRSVPVALYAGVDTEVDTMYGWSSRDMPIRLEYVEALSDVTQSQQRAEALLATAMESVFNPDRTLGGLCEGVTFVESTYDPREAGSKQIGLTVNFVIRYLARSGDPYFTVEEY